MKQAMSILLILFFSITGSSQQEDYMFLVSETCKRMDLNYFKGLEREKMNLELTKLGEEIRADHQDVTDSIVANIRKANPNYSNMKIEGTFVLEFLDLALDSCPDYADVIAMAVGPHPGENETLKAISTDIEAYLAKKKSGSYSARYYDVMTKLDKVAADHENLVKQDYPGGASDPELMQDVISYLSYESHPFLKVIVLGQIEMSYGNQ
jgi:hypothetical protein